MILISSTSCFSIIFTAILSPIILGEKFYWKIDGVTIGFITVGTLFAVTQKPKIIEDKLTPENVSQVSMDRLMHPNAVIYASILWAMLIWRIFMFQRVVSRLDYFYS